MIAGSFGDHDEGDQSEPQREAPGAIAATMSTDLHSTSYPGGDASKQIMAAARPVLLPALSANNPENRANEQINGAYARDLDSCITAAVPNVALEGFPRSPDKP